MQIKGENNAQNITQWALSLCLLTLLGLVGTPTAHAQEAEAIQPNAQPVGQWRSFLSYRSGLDIAWGGADVLYQVNTSGLLVYNATTGATQSYTKANGLSENTTTRVFVDRATGVCYIGYQDGTIDYFTQPGQFSTYYDIRNNRFFASKRINDFTAHQGRIFIATDFGIVDWDPALRRTRGSYTQFSATLNAPVVNAVAVFNDTLWIGLNSGLYAAPLSHPNLADNAAWAPVPGMGVKINTLAACPTGIYAQMGTELYQHTPATGWAMEDRAQYGSPGVAFRGLRPNGDNCLVAINNRAFIIQPTAPPLQLGSAANILVPMAAPTGGRYAYLDNNSGLMVFDASNTPSYPLRNSFPVNNHQHDLLISNRMLAIGPNGDGINEFDINGFRLFDLADQRGVNLPIGQYGIPDSLGGIGELAFDSVNQRLYIGTWNFGIIEYSVPDSQMTTLWNGTNSSLVGETFNGSIYRNIRITGLDFDSRGNLYATTWLAQGQRGLSVRTPEGQWRNIAMPDGTLLGLFIDNLDNCWIWTRDGGMILFNDREDPLSAADDVITTLNTNPGQGNLLANRAYCIAQDANGAVWVGTQQGISVFYSPQATLTRSAGGDASCPIFLGYCLLNEIQVSAIAIDGANRKWIGTSGSGLYLFNKDGTELIANFTMRNSPLPSENIISLAIDPATGELFVGTDQGLLAYQANVPEAYPDMAELLVFPNPVEPTHTGVIIIRGTVHSARTRIVTASGYLVRDLEAQGGQAEWDGRDVRGNLVQPGVYVVQCISTDGALAGRTKLMVMPR